MQYLIRLKGAYILGDLLPLSPVYKIVLLPWDWDSKSLQDDELYQQNYTASYSRGFTATRTKNLRNIIAALWSVENF